VIIFIVLIILLILLLMLGIIFLRNKGIILFSLKVFQRNFFSDFELLLSV